MRVENRLVAATARTFGSRSMRRSSAAERTTGFVVSVTSASRLAATSRSIACCMSAGTANSPMLATASARVRTVKNVRALRRVRSVTDLRTMAEDMTASSLVHDEAVADRDPATRARGELEVVGDVEHRRALVADPLQQIEHLAGGLR